MDSRNACKQLMNTQQEDARQKHKADARTALRTMIVYGDSRWFSLPDDENLIWHGDLRWCHNDGLMPSFEEFDWLIDYVADEAGNRGDDETEGDALLVLSAMRGLGSPTKRRSYIMALIRCMGPSRPQRVRHAALRAVSDAREEIASITIGSMPEAVDARLLDELSCAVLTAVRPHYDQTVEDGNHPDVSFYYIRDCCYARLIFALAMNDEWHERLTRDGHLERCASLADKALAHWRWEIGCYIAGIFVCINPSDNVLPLSPTQERLRTFIWDTWSDELASMSCSSIAVVPDAVTVTRLHLRGWDDSIPNDELTDLARDVHEALESLQRKQDILATFYLVPQAEFDAALSSVQGLDDDLRRMIENSKTSQRDDDPGS
ncbi:hypothetical protein EDB19DRAFT_1810709 [Suillus lakei]|nr:hypothetical protein EDB19DRAFT_1810709 [Suillus lakei]